MGLGLKRSVLENGLVVTGLASDEASDADDPKPKETNKNPPAHVVCVGGKPYMQFAVDMSATGGGVEIILMLLPPAWVDEWEYCESQ